MLRTKRASASIEPDLNEDQRFDLTTEELGETEFESEEWNDIPQNALSEDEMEYYEHLAEECDRKEEEEETEVEEAHPAPESTTAPASPAKHEGLAFQLRQKVLRQQQAISELEELLMKKAAITKKLPFSVSSKQEQSLYPAIQFWAKQEGIESSYTNGLVELVIN